MTSNSSERLLDRVLLGSDVAAFEVYDRYRTRLVRLAQRRLMGMLSAKVDPEDVSQEAFSAFFQMARQGNVRWQKEGDLWRLLAGIAMNKVKHKFEFYGMGKRNISLEIQSTDDIAGGLGRVVDDPLAEAELVDLVDHWLESEKPLMRTVLTMRLAGFSSEEIGRKIGRTSRTVRRLVESLQAKILAFEDVEFGRFVDSTIVSSSIEESEFKKAPRYPASNLKIDDYHLLRMIGRGSFAKVYLVKEVSTGSLFALKACQKKWARDTRVWESFMRESEMLARFRHAGIVRCFGSGLFPHGGRFLLLDLVEGATIDQAIENANGFADVKKWLVELAETIEFIHAHSVVHGDLKVSNVMVDKHGSVRLMDFGLGKIGHPDSHWTIRNQAIDILGFTSVIEALTKIYVGDFAMSLLNLVPFLKNLESTCGSAISNCVRRL